MVSLLLCAVLCAEPVEAERVTVCLTQLWETYDYDYDHPDGDYDYAEVASLAWKVEIKSVLSNGMIGWTYIGFINSTRVVRYGSDNSTIIWWSTRLGKTGLEQTTNNAVKCILKGMGKTGPLNVNVVWR